MNIHEYQAKELLAKFGVPVPAGFAAMSVDEAVEAAKKLPGPLYVVKAQIHAGGRGKGKFKELGPDAKGGVRLAKTLDDVRAAAGRLAGAIERTPFVHSRTLSQLTGAQVFLKAENLQRIGAFKFRGAYHAIARLTPDQLARGIVAYSSGNHAQAVALSAHYGWIRETMEKLGAP